MNQHDPLQELDEIAGALHRVLSDEFEALKKLDAEAVERAASLKEAREAVEREMINVALRKHNGKIAPAAAELGVSRPTLYELMEKLGIHRPDRELKVEA